MKSLLSFAAILAAAVLILPASRSAHAQATFTPEQRNQIEIILKDYLVQHPEILREMIAELESREAKASAQKAQAAVKENATEIFNSPHQVTLGAAHGDVTLVEFFDYNCAFCKRALSDMLTLLDTDKKLKVVLKEFPVLGEGSTQAAQVAVAVRMQDKSGKKYLEFHRKLLGGRGEANEARALAVAQEVGLDMARLKKDMTSPEVKTTIKESFALAKVLGINGTPSYVVGDDVVVGAVGLPALKAKVNTARCGKATC